MGYHQLIQVANKLMAGMASSQVQCKDHRHPNMLENHSMSADSVETVEVIVLDGLDQDATSRSRTSESESDAVCQPVRTCLMSAISPDRK